MKLKLYETTLKAASAGAAAGPASSSLVRMPMAAGAGQARIATLYMDRMQRIKQGSARRGPSAKKPATTTKPSGQGPPSQQEPCALGESTPPTGARKPSAGDGHGAAGVPSTPASIGTIGKGAPRQLSTEFTLTFRDSANLSRPYQRKVKPAAPGQAAPGHFTPPPGAKPDEVAMAALSASLVHSGAMDAAAPTRTAYRKSRSVTYRFRARDEAAVRDWLFGLQKCGMVLLERALGRSVQPTPPRPAVKGRGSRSSSVLDAPGGALPGRSERAGSSSSRRDSAPSMEPLDGRGVAFGPASMHNFGSGMGGGMGLAGYMQALPPSLPPQHTAPPSPPPVAPSPAPYTGSPAQSRPGVSLPRSGAPLTPERLAGEGGGEGSDDEEGAAGDGLFFAMSPNAAQRRDGRAGQGPSPTLGGQTGHGPPHPHRQVSSGRPVHGTIVAGQAAKAPSDFFRAGSLPVGIGQGLAARYPLYTPSHAPGRFPAPAPAPAPAQKPRVGDVPRRVARAESGDSTEHSDADGADGMFRLSPESKPQSDSGGSPSSPDISPTPRGARGSPKLDIFQPASSAAHRRYAPALEPESSTSEDEDSEVDDHDTGSESPTQKLVPLSTATPPAPAVQAEEPAVAATPVLGGLSRTPRLTSRQRSAPTHDSQRKQPKPAAAFTSQPSLQRIMTDTAATPGTGAAKASGAWVPPSLRRRREAEAAAGGGAAMGPPASSSSTPPAAHSGRSAAPAPPRGPDRNHAMVKIQKMMAAAEVERWHPPPPSADAAAPGPAWYSSTDVEVVGVCSVQGVRSRMEDAHVVHLSSGGDPCIFAVFDGHAGDAAAAFAAAHLPALLTSHPAYRTDPALAAVDSYHAVDAHFMAVAVQNFASALGGTGSQPPSTAQVAAAGNTAGTWDAMPPQDALFLRTSEMRDLPPPGHMLGDKEGDEGGVAQGAGALAGMARTAHAVGVRTATFVANGATLSSTADGTCSYEPAAFLPVGTLSGAAYDRFVVEEFLPKPFRAGTTALTVLLDVQACTLTVANVGDTMAVLARQQGTVAEAVAVEHSPASEESRINSAGGWVHREKEMSLGRLSSMDLSDPFVAAHAKLEVSWHSISRVNGDLGVSRALGDLNFKGRRKNLVPWYFPADKQGDGPIQFSADLVLATPDVCHVQLVEGDEFLLLACDGLWEAMPAGDAVGLVARVLQGDATGPDGPIEATPSAAARYLAEMALKLGSSDNITVQVVLLPTAVRFRPQTP